MSGEELIDLYMQLFGQEPMKLATVSIDNEKYKEMIGYCNITGTPLNDEIIVKFFGNQYDIVVPKNNAFNQFKKQ